MDSVEKDKMPMLTAADWLSDRDEYNPNRKSQRNESVSISIPESSIELNSSSRKTPDVPTQDDELVEQEDVEAMNKYHCSKDGDATGWEQILKTYTFKPHDKRVKQWKKCVVVFCLLAIFIDPGFSYLLKFKKDDRCIDIDHVLKIFLVTIRSITDLIFFMDMLVKFRLAYISPQSRAMGAGDLVVGPREIALHYRSGDFPLDLFNVLPLPQIIVIFVLPALGRSSEANFANNTLRVAVLIQYIPRLIRFVPLIAGRSPIGFIFESPWINFGINLLTFVLAGHVVGSCWYLLGSQRVNQCLRLACNVTDEQHPTCLKLLDCEERKHWPSLGNNWKQYENATACFSDGFDYGIYVKAVNLTTDGNIITRYVYSFFWGFQQISTMAGNQVPSYYVWEVIFTAVITGLGLLLLALLIGNMQNFLQGVTRRRQELLLRRRDINQWMNHRDLSKTLRKKVRDSERHHWAATHGVKEEQLMENLPEDLQREIRQPVFDFLKKVPILKSMDEPVLDEICDRLRQKTYIKEGKVLKKGRVVKNMIFIIRGKMESIGVDGKKVRLSKNDVCGEELLLWCLEKSSDYGGKRGHRLICKRTVTCSTNVEALVLWADDLEEVVSIYAKEFRVQIAKWKEAAATTIQVAWRDRKKSLSRTASTSHFG